MVSNIFYVHPYLGKTPSLTNIFQMGWNHQPRWRWDGLAEPTAMNQHFAPDCGVCCFSHSQPLFASQDWIFFRPLKYGLGANAPKCPHHNLLDKNRSRSKKVPGPIPEASTVNTRSSNLQEVGATNHTRVPWVARWRCWRVFWRKCWGKSLDVFRPFLAWRAL